MQTQFAITLRHGVTNEVQDSHVCDCIIEAEETFHTFYHMVGQTTVIRMEQRADRVRWIAQDVTADFEHELVEAA